MTICVSIGQSDQSHSNQITIFLEPCVVFAFGEVVFEQYFGIVDNVEPTSTTVAAEIVADAVSLAAELSQYLVAEFLLTCATWMN